MKIYLKAETLYVVYSFVIFGIELLIISEISSSCTSSNLADSAIFNNTKFMRY